MYELKKIINTFQIKDTDTYTIQNSTISSLELMEKAANAFVDAIEGKINADQKVLVLCGVGNNGGDGLAICRILKNKGISAQAKLLMFKDKLSEDCEANMNQLAFVEKLDSSNYKLDLSEVDIVIDGIFGSGLKKPVEGWIVKVINKINEAGKTIFSIDIPSGLMSDIIYNTNNIVKSDYVVSFQRPKLAFFFPENKSYIKKWKVADIGLDENFIQSQISNKFTIDENVNLLLKNREKHSHKGNYGKALLMVGEYGKIGAAVLASKACMRSGVGLLTTFVPKCGYDILQTSVPEAMCITSSSKKIITNLPDIKAYNSIGIGPGIGKNKSTAKLLEKLLKTSSIPLVIDADAINLISEQERLIKLIPENSILTPHILEFDRLVGESKSSMERFEKQKEFSVKNKCIIVLKDAYTCISSAEGDLYFNTTGNQGMATAGSGDVLTGIITGLVAQNYKPLEAAIIGVYFHGKAGDDALRKKSFSSLIASDIIDYLNISNN